MCPPPPKGAPTLRDRPTGAVALLARSCCPRRTRRRGCALGQPARRRPARRKEDWDTSPTPPPTRLVRLQLRLIASHLWVPPVNLELLDGGRLRPGRGGGRCGRLCCGARADAQPTVQASPRVTQRPPGGTRDAPHGDAVSSCAGPAGKGPREGRQTPRWRARHRQSVRSPFRQARCGRHVACWRLLPRASSLPGATGRSLFWQVPPRLPGAGRALLTPALALMSRSRLEATWTPADVTRLVPSR